MIAREGAELAQERRELVKVLQEHYAEFDTLLMDVMALLGFTTSEIQLDIGHYMVTGGESIMIQAQRSQAKTTIAAAFAVWDLIHNPKHRVLVVAAGGTQANEISTLIVRVIMTMDVLECLRPDKRAGDRTSVESFDLHHSLKGVDKSPSVACVGIGAHLQGKRANVLIADDVESTKNALTATMRAHLLHLTLDFTSIVTDGRIIWLGTPQTSESIYNTLPGRGVKVRVWPGRYPTLQQVANYGNHLAPLLVERMAKDPYLQTGGGLRGDQGQPIDPSYLGEAKLQAKELDQGAAYFQLQHMLNTRLLDALRFPLKPERLQILRLDYSKRVPVSITPDFTPMSLRLVTHGHLTYRVSQPRASPDSVVIGQTVMYVDPAAGGANGDETAYAIGGAINGNIYAFDVGGIPGGYSEECMLQLAHKAKEWGVSLMLIEKNMGFGAFREVITPILRGISPGTGIEDDMVHGQKELRIAATLEPIIGRATLVLNESILESDWASAQRYGHQKAATYTLFHQLTKLTRDRGALAHDDRLDALEGLCRYWQGVLAQDQKTAQAMAEAEAYRLMTEDPLGRKAYYRLNQPQQTGSVLNSRLSRW